MIGANAVSKILGAILKIPLTYILGEQGMAIYQTAFSVYIMMLSLITSGFPLAISRYTAEERALKRYGNIRYAVSFSAVSMSLLGILASLVMFFFSGFFALSMKDPKAQLAICAIAPSIFLVATGEVYKSFYQGYSYQTPTAISQVTESFIKLAVGYGLASWFAAFSHKYSAAAAIFGVTIGEFFATAVLMLMFIPFIKELKSTDAVTPKKQIRTALVSVALPMTLISLAGSGLGLLETSVIRNLLTSITFDENSARLFIERYSGYTHLFDNLILEKHLSFDGARWLFGAYSGYASTVFNLPIGILASFGVSILPVVTSAIAVKDYSRLSRVVSGATKAVLILAMPSAAILWLFPAEILTVLFKNTASSLMLFLMAPLIITSALSMLTSSVMHASGRIMTPFVYSLICSLVRIFLSALLITQPEINILGAIISSFISGILYFTLSSIRLKKDGISVISPLDFTKILLSGSVMMLISRLIYPTVSAFSGSAFGTVLVCTGVSLLGYVAMLFILGAIKKEEITCFSR